MGDVNKQEQLLGGIIPNSLYLPITTCRRPPNPRLHQTPAGASAHRLSCQRPGHRGVGGRAIDAIAAGQSDATPPGLGKAVADICFLIGK